MFPIFPMIPMYPMMNNIPTPNLKPPTIYSLLESIVNFDADERTKIKNLAKAGRNKIFDFEYPLSQKVDKEKFECMILNHFLMRRINFQTFTAFQIQLDVKLNEIMPIYNKMFDALEGWNIFEDGEKTTHKLTDERISENKTTADNSMNSSSTTKGNNTSDQRSSDTPQSKIENVKDGSYLTNYSYNTDNNSSEDKSEQKGKSTGTSNSKDNHTLNEEWLKTPADKIGIYKEFQENLNNIYGMIFKDLECLFFQIL